VQLLHNQLVAALQSIDVVLDTVVREEDRLIAILNSNHVSSEERFQALLDCVALTQSLQKILVEVESRKEPVRSPS
jgi:hypothetical protein